ncbi:uncharacterized protein KY384_005291 [Bacidia gigantensis]|uniref:uncharacterized protein n=1 Tax=Bacidia gigantensis TaxID=2732470 RepID=UPI001D05A758|nr:uncharacterized protein KY384_005291 [Bacidia gigantensis]KAG8529810.1 hypothetical protein KY384_005291 [Bacidia gigantensis]
MPNSSNPVNGISKRTKKKRSDESSPSPLYFGKLTEGLESEIEAFRPASNALLNISNIFHEYRSEVEVFESNYGAMQAKDDEIRDLNAAMRLWKSTRDEEVEKLKSELDSMAEKRESLREEKQEFEKIRDEKTGELQRSQNQLAEKENRLKDGYEKKLKKSKDALKEETRETVTQLQAANEKMTNEIAVLQADLAGAHETITNEKRDWSIVRSALNEENRTFRLELECVKNDFAIEARPDDFYKQKFLEIQENVKETSSRFFSTLPQSPGSKRKTFEGRGISCEIAEFAFLSESQVSTSLRLSAVEFLIVDSVRKLVWQPFAPEITPGETASAALFQTVSQELGSPRQPCGIHLESTDHCMLELLAPFTDEPDNSHLAEALTNIVRKAVDVWDISQRDACQLLIQNAPDPDDESGWMREDGDLFEDPYDGDVSAARSMSPICIFPKIVRLPSRGETSQMTIFRGRALFEDSRLLALGRKESIDLQKMMIDAHKQFASQKGGESGLLTRSDRRLSIAAQVTRP